MLLLHSTVCDRRMWEPQWHTLLEAGYRVVRCDWRGFGKSPVPDGPYDEAGDVVALLDALEVSSASIVASSYGGKVALEFAARWPERVESMVLLCSAIPDHEPTEELIRFWESEEKFVEADDIDAAVELNVTAFLGPEADAETRDRVRLMQRHAFDVQMAAEVEYAPDDVPISLDDVVTPTLVVSGAKDLPDFRLIAARLAAQLPHAEAVELDWAGHLPNLERPAEITTLLLDALASHPASRPGV